MDIAWTLQPGFSVLSHGHFMRKANDPNLNLYGPVYLLFDTSTQNDVCLPSQPHLEPEIKVETIPY